MPIETPMPMPAFAPGEREAEWEEGGGGGWVVDEVGFAGFLVNEEVAAAAALEGVAVEAPPVVVVAVAMECAGVAAADGAVLWTLVKMMG